MKILIDDGMQIRVGTGIGKYSRYLYENLKLKQNADFQVDLTEFQPKSDSKILNRLEYIKFLNSNNYINNSKQYDVIHYTNYLMPFRKNGHSKYVVTVHDLASFLYPETFSKIYIAYSRVAIDHAMKEADKILTVSNSVKKELIQYFPKFTNKIEVVYPGYYDEFSSFGNLSSVKYESDILNTLKYKKFFLFVGTIEKRKNVGMIIKAFQQMSRINKNNEFKLVLAGRPGYGYEDFFKFVRDNRLQNKVIFTGYISTKDCCKLYQEATAYVFPTIYEGFGSTQLECMANNLPIICSDIPTNREISGDYGIFFDLNSIDSLAKQMIMISRDKIRKRHIKIDKFLWENVIKDYISSYKNI